MPHGEQDDGENNDDGVYEFWEDESYWAWKELTGGLALQKNRKLSSGGLTAGPARTRATLVVLVVSPTPHSSLLSFPRRPSQRPPSRLVTELMQLNRIGSSPCRRA